MSMYEKSRTRNCLRILIFSFVQGRPYAFKSLLLKCLRKAMEQTNFLSREKETTRRVIAPKSEGSVNGTYMQELRTVMCIFGKRSQFS